MSGLRMVYIASLGVRKRRAMISVSFIKVLLFWHIAVKISDPDRMTFSLDIGSCLSYNPFPKNSERRFQMEAALRSSYIQRGEEY